MRYKSLALKALAATAVAVGTLGLITAPSLAATTPASPATLTIGTAGPDNVMGGGGGGSVGNNHCFYSFSPWYMPHAGCQFDHSTSVEIIQAARSGTPTLVSTIITGNGK